ncbi:unnamed protein product [Cylicocyclus nassatus]|uniref:Uncharacterized protein n=1 Tax=Cylicocyclus nassatus TaxID=53992 RepID=A0AA36H421_CYLNA|nr:unnamed protein product [Cylicocyclus nassatus]
MLIILIAVLFAPVLARISHHCNEVRVETEVEAERRRIYEHCTEVCDEQQAYGIFCADCHIPYEGYGCLRRRREVELNCIMDCDVMLPDRTAQLRCLESCGLPISPKFSL